MLLRIIFYPLTPNNLENQNSEKMKKAPGDVIILHMCTKNHDHMMYASWDVECDRENFLSFGPFFTLTPLTIQKIKFLKKKNTWRYYTFTNVYHNEDHMMHGSWDTRTDWQFFLSFWAICSPFTLMMTWEI